VIKIKRLFHIGILLIVLTLIAGCATEQQDTSGEAYKAAATDTSLQQPEESKETPVAVEQPQDIVEEPEEILPCKDSDEGKDYAVRGIVTTQDGMIYIDVCNKNLAGEKIDPSYPADSVFEYYCFKDNVYTKHYKCPNGCSNGACI